MFNLTSIGWNQICSVYLRGYYWQVSQHREEPKLQDWLQPCPQSLRPNQLSKMASSLKVQHLPFHLAWVINPGAVGCICEWPTRRKPRAILSSLTVAKELRLNLKWSVVLIHVVNRFLYFFVLVNDSGCGGNYLQLWTLAGSHLCHCEFIHGAKGSLILESTSQFSEVCVTTGCVSVNIWWSVMTTPKVEDTVFSRGMQVNKPGFYARRCSHDTSGKKLLFMIAGASQVWLTSVLPSWQRCKMLYRMAP